MSTAPSARSQDSRRWLVLALVVMASSGLTIFASYYAYRTAALQAEERFNSAVAEARGAIDMRMESYLALLRGAAALMTVESGLNRSQFRTYVERLHISKYYSGIQGIGYSEKVPPGREDQLVATMRQEGATNFHIWPRTTGEEVHTIRYLEPEDRRNQAALGYNMFSEAVRRNAMEQACDTGAAVASGRVTLVQEIEGPAQPGFLIYLPVYKTADVPATVVERRAMLRGFVYSPFRADDLFRNVFKGKFADRLDIEIYDGKRINPEGLLHRSTGAPAGEGNGTGSHAMHAKLPLEVASQTWTLRFFWNGGPAARWFLAPAIFAVGSILTVLLALLIRAEGAARHRAEEVNTQLRASEQSLREARSGLEQHAQQLEERVAERTALLQESVRDLEAILYHVAHDLRAPVRAMGSFATILQEEYKEQLDNQAHGYLKRVVGAALRMDHLVTDLLAFGRLAHSPMPIDNVSLEAPLEDVLKRKQAQIQEQSARIEVERPLPIVRANEVALAEVLSQLIDNSLKFATPGEAPCLRIWASTGSVVRMHIEDNGIGVKPQYFERIFRMFEKLHPYGIYPGTGIGLAIVRKAVERMGGRVGVDSRPDQGSIFWFELPAAGA